MWINVRQRPYPDIRALDEAARELGLGADRRVTQSFNFHFHARTYAVSADTKRLLNSEFVLGGKLPITKPREYRDMLRVSWDRQHGIKQARR